MSGTAGPARLLNKARHSESDGYLSAKLRFAVKHRSASDLMTTSNTSGRMVTGRHRDAVRLRRRSGLSLAEVVVSTMLLGMLALGAMQGVGHVFLTWSVQRGLQDGDALAQELLNEILQAEYQDPGETPTFGLETGEGATANLRTDFDDVDDYHGWSSNPPRERDNATPIAELTGWQRDVTVVLVEIAAPTTVTATAEGLKRITVTVTDPTSQSHHDGWLSFAMGNSGTGSRHRHDSDHRRLWTTDNWHRNGEKRHSVGEPCRRLAQRSPVGPAVPAVVAIGTVRPTSGPAGPATEMTQS